MVETSCRMSYNKIFACTQELYVETTKKFPLAQGFWVREF